MGYFQPTVIYRNPDDEQKNSIIRYIGNRVLNNQKKQNFLCGVTGAVGQGKSWTAISMCEIYSKMYNIHFDPKIHIITSLKELLILINSKEKRKLITEGSCLLFDEPQVEANSRKWQSEINLAFSQLISTFRNQRLVVFFAMPYLSMIDKQTRVIFQGEFLLEGFDVTTKMAHVKPRFLEWNEKSGKFYIKRLKIVYREPNKERMSTTKLHVWDVPMASKELLDVYETKKQKFTTELNKKLLAKLELDEKKESGKDKSEEFFKIKSLYHKFGENYTKILKKMPHLSAYAVEKYLLFIRREEKKVKNRL
jgi:hypothetical protein